MLPSGVQLFSPGLEHLDAVAALYRETGKFHHELDPSYYLSPQEGIAHARECAREALSGAGQVRIIAAAATTAATAAAPPAQELRRRDEATAGVPTCDGGVRAKPPHQLVGFVSFLLEAPGYPDSYFSFGCGVVEEVYVRASWRRRGRVGAALMQAAEAALWVGAVRCLLLAAAGCCWHCCCCRCCRCRCLVSGGAGGVGGVAVLSNVCAGYGGKANEAQCIEQVRNAHSTPTSEQHTDLKKAGLALRWTAAM
jgi:hypothetical protein